MFVSIAKSIFLGKMKPLFGAQSPSPHQIPDGKQDLFPLLVELVLTPIPFEFS
jgi:hypothetical protein